MIRLPTLFHCLRPVRLTIKKRRKFLFRRRHPVEAAYLIIGCFRLLPRHGNHAHGQALPTASRLGSIQVGAGWFSRQSRLRSESYSGNDLLLRLQLPHSIGVEGEIHYSVITPTDVSENIYLLGPRYIVRHKRVEGYAKLFSGQATSDRRSAATLPQTDTYFVYVIGGRHRCPRNPSHQHPSLRLRDAEVAGFPPNGLTPLSGSVGVAYVFH